MGKTQYVGVGEMILPVKGLLGKHKDLSLGL